MEPKFQTSFIPKAPASESVPLSSMRAEGPDDKGIVWVMSMILFWVSLVALVALVGTRFVVARSIAGMSDALASASAEISPERIADLNRAHSRITSAESLLARHISVANLFAALEQITSRSVRFTEFSFKTVPNENGVIETRLVVKGEAQSYAALSAQASVIERQTFFKNTLFSDFDLTERGQVSFTFSAVLDPSLTSYVEPARPVISPR